MQDRALRVSNAPNRPAPHPPSFGQNLGSFTKDLDRQPAMIDKCYLGALGTIWLIGSCTF